MTDVARQPDLLTCKWRLQFHKTIERDDSGPVDMYLLYDGDTDEGIVSIAVPVGRSDIAEFILRSCRAGQRVMCECGITDVREYQP